MFATIAGCVRDQGGILQQPERSTAESPISSTDKLIIELIIELGIETETVNFWLFARNTIWSSQTLSSSAMNTTRRKWTRRWQDCNIRSQKLLKKTEVL